MVQCKFKIWHKCCNSFMYFTFEVQVNSYAWNFMLYEHYVKVMQHIVIKYVQLHMIFNYEVKKTHFWLEWLHEEHCDGDKMWFASLMVDTKPILTLGCFIFIIISIIINKLDDYINSINSIITCEIMMLLTYTDSIGNAVFENSKI